MPQKKSNLPTTLILGFQPPECGKINFCFLSHPVCGTWLQHPEKTKTHRDAWPHPLSLLRWARKTQSGSLGNGVPLSGAPLEALRRELKGRFVFQVRAAHEKLKSLYFFMSPSLFDGCSKCQRPAVQCSFSPESAKGRRSWICRRLVRLHAR